MQKRHSLHLFIFGLCAFILVMLTIESSSQRFRAQLETGTLHGRFGVFDGDTMAFRFKKIKLHGIDAVELDQTCLDKHGKEWECGKKAKQELIRLTEKRDVFCAIEDEHNKVLIASCSVDGLNLSKAMVKSGYAVAYRRFSEDYVGVEKRARKQKKGIWKGTFMEPEKWREEKAKREGKTKPEDQSGVNQPKP